MTKVDIDNIIEFWSLFKSIASDLKHNPTGSDLVSQVDAAIDRLGPFDWEIGPYTGEEYYFSVSPNLDASKLETTKEFMKYAPVCAGWTFLPSKPVKSDWKGMWKMLNENGKEILIDSNNWRYVLYQFDDQTFDIDIIINNIDGNEDTHNMAIDIGLTGYLGEERFMDLIKHIKVISEPEEEHKNKTTLVKYIRDHIESLP